MMSKLFVLLSLVVLVTGALAQTMITNCQKLQDMNLDLAESYVLANDIDCSDTVNWNGGQGFEPVGSGITPFAGSLDGKNQIVLNLTINRPATDYVGLFGVITNSSIISNIGLVGGVAYGCKDLGHLVGFNDGGMILNTYAVSSVYSSCGNTGGLVGRNNGFINKSYTAGNEVVGSDNTGGLVGTSGQGATIIKSYSTCRVWGGAGVNHIGGLAGANGGDILTSYSTGSASGGSGSAGIGGLIGYQTVGSLHQCYSTGEPTGAGSVGGLVGYNFNGDIRAYWDTQASGRQNSVGAGLSDSSIGKTTVEMYRQATFTSWDFTDTWWIDEGNNYPLLRWFLAPTAKNPLPDQDIPVDEPYRLIISTVFEDLSNTGLNYTAVLSPNNVLPAWLTFNEQSQTLFGTPQGGDVGDYTIIVTACSANLLCATDEFTLYVKVLLGISSCTELQAMQNDLYGVYYLTNDIDCSDTVNWNGGQGFEPVGNDVNMFFGSLDGKNYDVYNLTINRPSSDHVALFGCLGSSAVEIANLGLVLVTISGGHRVASFAGYNVGGSINKCYASGNILGTGNTGGLVGSDIGGNINDSYTTTDVEGGLAGGLAGYSAASIERCYATGKILGGGCGGLVGHNHGSISHCYASGDVIGTGNAGGLVSNLMNNLGPSSITYSYATGSVSSDVYAGGLVSHVSGGTISGCYATGAVLSGSSAGGLVGASSGGTVTTSYWDKQTSGRTTSAGGVGKTTSEMYQQATFVSWDFQDAWWIDEGNSYPRLLIFLLQVKNPLVDQMSIINKLFSFTIPLDTMESPSDPCLDYSAQLLGGASLPTWLTFTSNTRCFSGTPPSGAQGGYEIEVIASEDSGFSVSDVFVLTVINRAPFVVNPLIDQTAYIGSLLSYTFLEDTFEDEDEDFLRYSTQRQSGGSLPEWLLFENVTRTFSGVPVSGDQGEALLEVIANDGFGGTAQDTFLITVPNRIPVLQTPVAFIEATNGEQLEWTVPLDTFSDGDNDPLIYNISLTNDEPLPNWLSFEVSTAQLSGTPTQRAEEQLLLTANDGFGGEAATTFTLTVPNTAPTLVIPLSPQAAALHDMFNFLVPAETFMDLDGDPLDYEAFLQGGDALPNWMYFDANARVFSGVASERNSYIVVVQVNDNAGGNASTTFEFRVANQTPQLNQTLSNQTGWVTELLTFSFSQALFIDEDGDTITYTVTQLEDEPLPNWLTFTSSTRTFTGIPISGAQGITAIVIFANDGFGGEASTLFHLIIPNRSPTAEIVINEQRFTAEQPFLWPLPNGTFVDLDVDPLHFSAQQAGGAPLPTGILINSNNGALSGTLSKDQTPFAIVIIAEDFLGEQAHTAFNVTINHPPILGGFIDSKQASVGNPFLFTFSPDLFTDSDGDILHYEARQSDTQPLPVWLSLDSNARTFIGIPHLEDQGFLFVDLIAIDPYEGYANIIFGIAISDLSGNQAPFVAVAIPAQTAYSDSDFSFIFAEETFEDPDDDPLTYTATLEGNIPLPDWLNFIGVSRTFSGIPDRPQTLRIALRAEDDRSGVALTSFTIQVMDSENYPPTVLNPVAQQVVKVGQRYQFTLPSDTFIDANDDLLTIAVSQGGGKALPKWLDYDSATGIFSGKPTMWDTDTYGDRVHRIEVLASDGEGSVIADFDLLVEGESFWELFIKIVAGTGTALSTLYAIYRNRAWLWQHFCKRWYRLPLQTAIIGKEYKWDVDLPGRSKGKKIERVQAFKNGNVLPDGKFRPEWLRYIPKSRQIIGTPLESEDCEILTVRVYGYDARILAEFTLGIFETEVKAQEFESEVMLASTRSKRDILMKMLPRRADEQMKEHLLRGREDDSTAQA